jgi:hypothetical protein
VTQPATPAVKGKGIVVAKAKEQVCVWIKLHMIKSRLGCSQSAAIRASLSLAMTQLGLATKDELIEDIRDYAEQPISF